MTTHIKFLTKIIAKNSAVYALDASLNWVRLSPRVEGFSVFESREVCISGFSIEEIANEAQALRDKCPLGVKESWTAYRFLGVTHPGSRVFDPIIASFTMYVIPREVTDDRVLKPLSEHILFDLREAGF